MVIARYHTGRMYCLVALKHQKVFPNLSPYRQHLPCSEHWSKKHMETTHTRRAFLYVMMLDSFSLQLQLQAWRTVPTEARIVVFVEMFFKCVAEEYARCSPQGCRKLHKVEKILWYYGSYTWAKLLRPLCLRHNVQLEGRTLKVKSSLWIVLRLLKVRLNSGSCFQGEID